MNEQGAAQDAEGVRLCYACRCPFLTEEAWDQRHSDVDGEDVHEECCSICHGDDTDHQRPLIDGPEDAK